VGELFKQQIVRYLNEDGKRVRAGTPGARRIEEESRKWYGEYRDKDNNLQRVPLAVDKKAARQELARLEREAELARAGLADPDRSEQACRPLTEHLEDYRRHLEAKEDCPKHVRQTIACVERTLTACRFATLADLEAEAVEQFLATLRSSRKPVPPLDPGKEWYTKTELARAVGIKPSTVPGMVQRHRLPATGNGKARRYPRETAQALRSLRVRGRSVKTSNLYLAAVKAFSAWLAERSGSRDPLARMAGGNVKADRRHDRRALPLDELRAILQAARSSAQGFRGLAGIDRAILYAVACASGFRANELASLRPTAFDLDGEPPTVNLAAEIAKNGKPVRQPLPADLAEALRDYLAGKPARSPVWPGTWPDAAADMLRLDLDQAGIPYAVDGPDGPLYADFHALRHSFIALLDKSGATLKEAMQLARHSDPKLTMAVYGRAALNDLAAAVDRLPGLMGATLEPAALRLTGTDSGPQESGLVTGRVTGASDGQGREASEGVASVLSGEGKADSTEPQDLTGFAASGRQASAAVASPRGRICTFAEQVQSLPCCFYTTRECGQNKLGWQDLNLQHDG
jgi:integrase